MGRYTGPVCRLCRQVGEKLFLKGERCYTPKCAWERRRRPPGQNPPMRRRYSDYGLRLREKQKAKYIYGLRERQFRRYVEKAQKQPGETGFHLLSLLERRLDNVVFRLGFAHSRRQARQIVRHGHITVNGRKVDIPSYTVKPGDVIGWKESSKDTALYRAMVEAPPTRPVPSWLEVDRNTMTGRVVNLPQPQDLDARLDTRLIIEFYAR